MSIKTKLASLYIRLNCKLRNLLTLFINKFINITPLGKDPVLRAWRHYHTYCLFHWKLLKRIPYEFNEKLSKSQLYCNVGAFRRAFYRLDCCLSWILLGSEPEDYFSEDYFKKGYLWRNRTVTRLRLNFLKQELNNYEHSEAVHDKLNFYRTWNDYLGRKWCLLSETDWDSFEEKFKNCSTLFIKSRGGYGGLGVEKIEINSNLREIYDRLLTNENDILVEECITQSGILNDFNPPSVNTIRVITVKPSEKAYVINTFFRCGCGDVHVDNLHSGGILFPVNRDTGIIDIGRSYATQYIQNHPLTGIKITGQAIPDWDKIKELCCEAHALAPKDIRWIGWDVVWSDGELYLIEANTGPGTHTAYHSKENIWKDYLEVLRTVKKNEKQN